MTRHMAVGLVAAVLWLWVAALTEPAAAQVIKTCSACGRVWHFNLDRQMRDFGGMLSFELEGGMARGRRFLDALRMISLSSNLGDSRTIATHPASTTHSKLTDDERNAVGITPGLVRISVGLESLPDILEDIDQALGASSKG